MYVHILLYLYFYRRSHFLRIGLPDDPAENTQVDQLTEQRNDCSSDSQCSLTGQEDVNVGSFNTINQKLDQSNECSIASDCK